MERFLLNTEDYQRHYMCNYSVDKVPLASRQKIALSTVLFIVGFIEIVLYIPCLIAICKRLENPCYKFMFMMGVLDVLALFICTIITAVFGIIGVVYCSAPNFIYVLGSCALSLWIWESSVEILLAVNRCLEVGIPNATETLFKGWRTWLWMIPPSIYGLYVLFFEKPAAFTGIYFAWFFDPHIGYFPPSQASAEYYRSDIFNTHNWIVMLGLSGAYTIFGILFANRSGAFHRAFKFFCRCRGSQPTAPTLDLSITDISRTERLIFTQVILISLVNTAAAFIYLYMQYNETTPSLIVFAQFLWSQAHGIPPFIYLTLNRTLRCECMHLTHSLLKMLGCEKIAVKMGLAKATSNTNNSLAPTKIFDLNRSRVEMEQNGKQKGAHAHA